jgi:hypothetical protein
MSLNLIFHNLHLTRLAAPPTLSTNNNNSNNESIDPNLIVALGNEPLFKTNIILHTEQAHWDFSQPNSFTILNKDLVTKDSNNLPVVNINIEKSLALYVEDNNYSTCYANLGNHTQSTLDLLRRSLQNAQIIHTVPFKLKGQPLGTIEFTLTVHSRDFWRNINYENNEQNANTSNKSNYLQFIELVTDLIGAFVEKFEETSPLQHIFTNSAALSNLLRYITASATSSGSLSGEKLRKLIFPALISALKGYNNEARQQIVAALVDNSAANIKFLEEIRQLKPFASSEQYIEQFLQFHAVEEQILLISPASLPVNGWPELKELLGKLREKYSHSANKAKEIVEEQQILAIVKDLEEFHQILQFDLKWDNSAREAGKQAILQQQAAENEAKLNSAQHKDNTSENATVSVPTAENPAGSKEAASSLPAVDSNAFTASNIMRFVNTEHVWLCRLLATFYSKATKFWPEEDSANDPLLSRVAAALEQFQGNYVTTEKKSFRRARSAKKKNK